MNKETKQIHKRMASLDALKLFAMFLVIWGHCIQWFQTMPPDNNAVYRYIYSFHMSLFMMISGFFSLTSMKMPFKQFVVNKFKRLLYPCFIWGFLIWVICESTHSFHFGHTHYNLAGLLTDFYWFSDFWFLKCCFLCFLLAYFGQHFGQRKIIWIPLTLILSQAIGVFHIAYLYPCFLIGMELKGNPSILDKASSTLCLIAIVFIAMLSFWNHDTWQRSHTSLLTTIQQNNITLLPSFNYNEKIICIKHYLVDSNYYPLIIK